MAVAAFLRGDHVLRRFARGSEAIVAIAACAEYFGVIDEARNVEGQRIVARLACIARWHVGGRLRLNAGARIRGVAGIAVVR